MILSLIAAADEDNVIGGENKLLWQLPDDMKFFRESTKGRPVIMGRKTFESIGRVLPHRRNIVVTRNADFVAEGAEVVGSLEAALEAVQAYEGEAFIIGGGEIYAQAIGRADRVYLTRVHARIEGDAHFPALSEAEWNEVRREEHPADERHAHPFTFLVYERRQVLV